ncbi:4-oxalocrotonate tautomerase [Janthinobacterium sp. CG_23.3]|uniref:tautomerase family protein n=1 Tax=unclassified Janthinobacterium TaxID=2610881 RepID=UPI00034BE29F|nr:MULTISPECIES: 4-oxalocrotonate tautomerase family protein [unclassified Janthinobacterium]MEC5163540.1 4-oxalocrotonate tautomerase [Janthinobacterium sp. CG_S6]
MPILNVRLSTRPDSVQYAAVAGALSRLTEQILHKDPALTSVAMSHVEPAHWFVGGAPLSQQGKTSFFLDILVTDETNTAAEKGAYIAAVFKEMAALLGELHDVSYIHVHDARAAAWGYGGKTQQYRGIKKQLDTP